jgi:hypothetical protein
MILKMKTLWMVTSKVNGFWSVISGVKELGSGLRVSIFVMVRPCILYITQELIK